ncbi:MAG TPA: PLP-dependent lyase/thiolase, partial [Actinomycetota bacterium]|nr:PLP-dependent lyase/thiolase [Actinomycetota bacterium]
AVVARAAGRTLRVFVPPDGEPAVLRRLKELEADVVTCVREPRERGDPTYRALRRALDDGALPFTCQGPENGLTVEGGETLAWEIVSDLRAADAALDRVFVQVGGGALASSVVQGFEEAVELDALPCAPRVHAVQTRGAFPLQRAYERVARRIADGETAVEALRYAARHRGEFMWPWEEDPRSVARGILDDETYDWRAVVEGMLATGGSPVVVGEDVLRGANDLAVRSTGVDVDPTGSAGLAGLISLRRAGEIEPGERVAVLFTGIRRDEGG